MTMLTAFVRNVRRICETFRGSKSLVSCDRPSMKGRKFVRLFCDLVNSLSHSKVAFIELTRPGHSFLKELLQMLATINMVEPQTRRFVDDIHCLIDFLIS